MTRGGVMYVYLAILVACAMLHILVNRWPL